MCLFVCLFVQCVCVCVCVCVEDVLWLQPSGCGCASTAVDGSGSDTSLSKVCSGSLDSRHPPPHQFVVLP